MPHLVLGMMGEAGGLHLPAKAIPAIVGEAQTAWCFSCEEAVSIGDRHSVCPNCGSHHLQVTGGDELRIKELEVD